MPSSNRYEYSLFFIVKALYFPILFFMPVFLEEKGITGWKMGLLLGEAYIIGIVMSFPMGLLNDRREPKKLILLSLLLNCIFIVILSYSESFYAMFLLFLLFGIAKNLFQISFDSLFFKQIIKGEGCIHIGRYQAVFSTAVMSGMFITSLCIDRISLEWFYLGAGFIYLLSMIIASRLSLSGTNLIPVSEYKKDLMKPEFIILAVLIFLFALHWGAEDTCYGLFLKHYLGVSRAKSSIYMMSEFITFGIASYILSRLVDRYNVNLRWIFISGVLISGVSLILKVNMIFEISMLFRMLHGIGDGMVIVVIYYGVSRVFAIEKIGGNMSIVVVLFLLGSFVGSIVFSRIGKIYGYETSFVITGIILIATSILLIIYGCIFKLDNSIPSNNKYR